MGIEGYKQFQLPPIIFYIAEKKGVQKSATNTYATNAPMCAYKMYPQSHSCAQYHRTAEVLVGIPRLSSCLEWESHGIRIGLWHTEVCRSKQGRAAFTRRAEHLYYLHSTQCFLLSIYSSFSCRKGVVLRNT